jgi:hypothetical protein
MRSSVSSCLEVVATQASSASRRSCAGRSERSVATKLAVKPPTWSWNSCVLE